MPLEIMMPFYGSIAQFRIAVESVLAQTSDDWRLTIVDDVYPDPAAGEWALGLGDPRVVYLRNTVNLGVSGNFRHCVDLMKEQRAVILGCDDIMLPGFVARVAQLSAEFPDAAIIQPGVEVIDDEGASTLPLADRIKRWYRPKGRTPRALAGEPLAASLLRGNWAYFPSLVWSVPVLKSVGFRPDLEVVLDLATILEIVRDGGSLVLDDLIVFQYRRHLASVSSFTAADGSRFVEERSVMLSASDDFQRLGWTKAAAVGRRHLSSRLNALAVLTRAARTITLEDRRKLVSHIVR